MNAERLVPEDVAEEVGVEVLFVLASSFTVTPVFFNWTFAKAGVELLSDVGADDDVGVGLTVALFGVLLFDEVELFVDVEVCPSILLPHFEQNFAEDTVPHELHVLPLEFTD